MLIQEGLVGFKGWINCWYILVISVDPPESASNLLNKSIIKGFICLKKAMMDSLFEIVGMLDSSFDSLCSFKESHST